MSDLGRKALSKKFGQVFLHDRNIARLEVNALEVRPGIDVLEIGPGPGILTEMLLERGANVTAIEPDHVQYENLAVRFGECIETGQLKLIKEDFLEIEPAPYARIIGNIPYHISSPILFKLFEYDFENAVIMVQKEFAERLIAKEGTKQYSRLTVNAKVRFEVELVRTVPRSCFVPVPKVDSAIVRLEKKEFPGKFPIEFLDEILIKLFSMRRKKVKNILPGAPEAYSGRRPEDLKIEEIIEICQYLYLSRRLSSS